MSKRNQTSEEVGGCMIEPIAEIISNTEQKVTFLPQTQQKGKHMQKQVSECVVRSETDGPDQVSHKKKPKDMYPEFSMSRGQEKKSKFFENNFTGMGKEVVYGETKYWHTMWRVLGQTHTHL